MHCATAGRSIHFTHMEDRVYNEPSSVVVEADQVFVDGPDGVAVALTPEATNETGRSPHSIGC